MPFTSRVEPGDVVPIPTLPVPLKRVLFAVMKRSFIEVYALFLTPIVVPAADADVAIRMLLSFVVSRIQALPSCTVSLWPGVVVPTPTLPLARTVRPEPAVELDAIRAIVPVVTAPVLATYNNPLVELIAAPVLVSESKLPVVSAFAVNVIGFWVVAVDQFQVWAFSKLSMLLVADAAVIADSADEPPLPTTVHAVPLK